MVVWMRPAVKQWGLALSLALSVTADAAMLTAAEGQIERLAAPANLAPLEAEAPDLQSVQGEVIRERYPNRQVRIERNVIRDEQGDFVNHGAWKMLDEDGLEMGHGQYRQGLRHGSWVRNFESDEAEMLTNKWGRMFEAPYTSTITFVDDQMQGVWVINDAQQRPMLVWQYEQGQRQGRSVWYFPNGNKWREAEYQAGELAGAFTEWASDGSVVVNENYHDGYRHGAQIEWAELGVKKTEAHFLFAKDVVEQQEDWWEGVARTKVLGKQGRDQRHGMWTAYFRNGQKALEGEFDHDQPTGKFVWWHPNGQRAIEGQYVKGTQHGVWSWWHESGKRSIQGGYQGGAQTGEWTWWNQAGEVNHAVRYAVVGDEVAAAQVTLKPLVVPPAVTMPQPTAESLQVNYPEPTEITLTDTTSALKARPLAKSVEKIAAPLATKDEQADDPAVATIERRTFVRPAPRDPSKRLTK